MSPVCPVGNLSKSQPPGAAIVNIITQPLKLQWLPIWHSPLSSLQLYQGTGWHLLFTASALVTLCLYNHPYPTIIIWKISPSWVLISTYFLANLRMYCILASRHLSVPCPAISPTRGIHSFLAICGDTELGDAINLAGLAWAGKSWMEEEENILKWPKIFSDCKR